MSVKAVLSCCLMFIVLKYIIVDVDGGPARRPKKKKITSYPHVYYKDQLPRFRGGKPSYYKRIPHTYFETVYDTKNKLPVYSAYMLYKWKKEYGRVDGWKTDPQLLKEEQPKTTDFKDIAGQQLNGGHLYPQFYNSREENKIETNFVTNIALQYKNFNQNTWLRLENALYKVANTMCNFRRAKRQFITGVVPSKTKFSKKGLNIPESFWTAVCCDTSQALARGKQADGWSFVYIIKNQKPDVKSRNVEMYFVDDFVKQPFSPFVTLFGNIEGVRSCLFNENRVVDVVKRVIELNGRRDRFYLKGKLNTLYENSLKQKQKKT
ncbi:endonuclease domain-containing 1 protein-like [Mytilus edulis]|uniref:endonuclease domain-containing 1 protein-like n=1 Tax=Mytilus edulis TaxID=6550 RepID=UPI0039EDF851